LRFAFIHRLRGKFSIKRMCRILMTDRSNVYAWARAQALRDQRELDEQELAELIVGIHSAHPAYGAERITRELKRQGIAAGCRRVTRLMRERGIVGITRRKRRSLTRANASAAVVPNLTRRKFTAPMPGLKLIGDISCFPIMYTDSGSKYHSRTYRNTLRRPEVRPSTSRTGSCLDGAAARSFLATI
jgi:transposase InsO family protein